MDLRSKSLYNNAEISNKIIKNEDEDEDESEKRTSEQWGRI